jgi:hypothetical protein
MFPMPRLLSASLWMKKSQMPFPVFSWSQVALTKVRLYLIPIPIHLSLILSKAKEYLEAYINREDSL